MGKITSHDRVVKLVLFLCVCVCVVAAAIIFFFRQLAVDFIALPIFQAVNFVELSPLDPFHLQLAWLTSWPGSQREILSSFSALSFITTWITAQDRDESK